MKVGDYIRTDDGLIGKVVSEPYEYKDSIGCDIDFGNNDVFNEYEMYQRIIKSSPNIIDLIDYEDVVKIIYDGKEFICKVVNVLGTKGVQINLNYSISLNATKIKSIVTKEQFSCMEYKIGDE